MKKSALLTFFFSMFLIAFFVNINNVSSDNLAISNMLNSQGYVELAVKFKDTNFKDANSFSVLSSNIQNSFEKKAYYSNISNRFYMKLNKSEFQKLLASGEIEDIEYKPSLRLFLQESVSIVNASKVWIRNISDVNITGSGQTVCIIDSGVNYSHPALGGCFGDGCKIIGGYDFVNSDSDPMDDNGHGTHVAGIVASEDSVYRGIAPNAKIVALKACDATGSCDWQSTFNSLDWCINNASLYNITAISMSLGSSLNSSSYCDDYDLDMTSKINNAVAKNISVVIASGNDGNSSGISFPACIENATSVASSTKTDEISSFSNRASILDLLAPGSSITSTYLSGFATMSGTSMAAPHVSGSIALLQQSRILEIGRNYNVYEIERILKNNGKSINDSTGLNYSRINIFNSIDSFIAPNFSWIGYPPNSSYYGKEVVINLSAEDNVNISFSNISINSESYAMSNDGSYYYYVFNPPSNGSYVYNVTFFDITGNSNSSESVILEVKESNPPAYYNISSSITYGEYFNASWIDDSNISYVWADLDGINYSAFLLEDNVYFLNYSFAAGNYSMIWYANDSLGNLNYSSLNVSIYQKNPNLNLTLIFNNNSYFSNIIIENGSFVNLSASSIAEDKIKLYINNSLINEDYFQLSNYSQFNYTGSFNVAVIYNGSQNYSFDSMNYTIKVESSFSPPTVYKMFPKNNSYLNYNNVTFKINASDASLRNITLYLWNSTSLYSSNFSYLEGMYNESNFSYSLEEGNYSWNVLACDYSNNCSYSVNGNFSLVIDRTNPSSALYIEDSSITTSDSVLISCAGDDLNFDYIELLIDGNRKNSSSSYKNISYSYHPSSSGNKEIICNVSDKAGNYNIDSDSIEVSSVEESTSSTSSSEESTSSVNSGESSKYSKTSKTFTLISAGESIELKTSYNTKEQCGISLVIAKIKHSVEYVLLEISKVSPSEVDELTDVQVYSYIEINHENLSTSNIDEAKISFEVLKNWLSEKNISKEEIVLKRYGGKWEDLETIISEEDSNKVYYNSTSPGLSVFAIATKEKKVETSISSASSIEQVEEKFLEEKNYRWYYVLGTVLPLLIIAVIYYFWRRKKFLKGYRF